MKTLNYCQKIKIGKKWQNSLKLLKMSNLAKLSKIVKIVNIDENCHKWSKLSKNKSRCLNTLIKCLKGHKSFGWLFHIKK